MNRPRTIADLLGPPGLFYRSVSLERDTRDPAAGRSFVLTPWLERGASGIVAGLSGNSTRRAWRIIGDFGVGKSALSLALIQAFDPRLADPAMPMRRLALATADAPRLYPLLVMGCREGLAAALAVAIRNAAGELFAAPKVQALLGLTDPFEAIMALRDAVRGTGRFDGLLVVIDEMGKFLEASSESDGFDVFRLQSLAAAAARSGGAPLAIILILHKGFQSYAEDWRSARRSEWEKVAERFEEFVFDHPLSHTAALLAAALAVDLPSLPGGARKASQESAKRVRALGWLGPKVNAERLECWPLHPATVPVLSRFFASFGQNERSLFGFAASEEPNSLRAFAAATPLGGSLYGIHHFFDYISSSFGHRLTSRGCAGDWERIGDVLDRAADADSVETAVLKTVGVLNLLDASDLSATADSVQASLIPEFSPSEVGDAIERLISGGLLFRRPGRAEIRLWTSRRVDLSAIWADAERDVDARSILTDLPKHLCGLPVRAHVLARRHSVITGTNRRFAVRCMDVPSLAAFRTYADADGALVAVLCGDDEDLQIAQAWAAQAARDHPELLTAVVPPQPDLGPATVDLLRHRWVANNAPSLREDAHAAAEIERSIADLEAGLVSALEQRLGLRGQRPVAGIQLFREGEPQTAVTPIHATVSALCDQLFRCAPLVENELVNRHSLTSAGAGARQRLIEAMFGHASDPDLGFKPGKAPPERALYLSLLRRGRIHREQAGDWIIAPPPRDDDPLRLRPTLDAIEGRLSKAADRVPLTDLYDLTSARPFGVRRGLSPLLLAVILVAAGHRIALFERGTYCTRLDGPAFMRILKSPELFALQWVSLEGVRADVFQRLAVLLDQVPEEGGIRVVVDPLIRFGAGLPFHVQHSATLSETAQRVRRALAQASSPVDLIFSDLPAACGCEAFGPNARANAGQTALFVERLDAAVNELRACYPRLLEAIRAELLTALAASDRASLAERAAGLAFRIHDQQLRTFVGRLADAVLSEDVWTEALGGAVVGKPPSRWRDDDVAMWRSKLAELASQFQRVEATVFGDGSSPRSAVRVSLTRSDGHERAVVLQIGDLTEGQEGMLQTIVRLAAEADLSLDKVAALLSLEAMTKGRERDEDKTDFRKDTA
jgi:hypothetical protein